MSPQMYFNNMLQQQPMLGIGIWNTQQQYGFQNLVGSSQRNFVRSQQNASPSTRHDDDMFPIHTKLKYCLRAETKTPTDGDGSDGHKKKRAHKRKAAGEPRSKATRVKWTLDEDMNLGMTWLEITEDPKCSNYQREITYWVRILTRVP